MDLLHSLAAMLDGCDRHCSGVSENFANHTSSIWMIGGNQHTSLKILIMILKGYKFFIIIMSSVFWLFLICSSLLSRVRS